MSDSVIHPIPDRIEHLGSDLDGILRATGDGQPPTVAVPGEHYVTPEALASGLAGKADVGITARERALLALDDLVAWDPFDGSGSLHGSQAPSGQTWSVSAGVLVRDGGQVRQQEAGFPQMLATIDVGADEVELGLDIFPGIPGRSGLIIKYIDDDNYLCFRPFATAWQLGLVLGGQASSPGQGPYPLMIGRRYRVRCLFAGGRAIAFVNGKLIVEQEISSEAMAVLGSAARCGIYAQNNTENRFDNFFAMRVGL